MSSFKEITKIVDQLATFISDASQEVRSDAKKAFKTLSQLCSKTEFEQITSRALGEQKYNKVKELLEKGFQTSMSDFNPAKQSSYRGDSNRSSRRMAANSNSSNGFDLEGGNSSLSKFKSSSSIPTVDGEYSPSNSRFSLHSKSNLKANKSNLSGQHASERNSTISVISNTSHSRIQKVIPKDVGDGPSNTDVEDKKSTRSSQSKFQRHKRISKSIIKKTNSNSDLQSPGFSKKEQTEVEVVEEKDIFTQI